MIHFVLFYKDVKASRLKISTMVELGLLPKSICRPKELFGERTMTVANRFYGFEQLSELDIDFRHFDASEQTVNELSTNLNNKASKKLVTVLLWDRMVGIYRGLNLNGESVSRN